MKFSNKNTLAALLRQHILVLYETEEYHTNFLKNLNDIFGENVYFYNTEEVETPQFCFTIKRYNSGSFCGERWNYIYYEDSISREELLNNPKYCINHGDCVKELPLKCLLADSGHVDEKIPSNEATKRVFRDEVIKTEEDKESIYGYKIIPSDWKCKDKQYTCPGIFEEEGALSMCIHGMHFCQKLKDCFRYYDGSLDNHYVKVEAYGKVIEIDSKCCTNKMKIIKELSIEEIIEILKKEIKDNNWGNNMTSHHNDGEKNCGQYNIGTYNYGLFNNGSINVGYWNKGDSNEGGYNIGDCNIGGYNKGHFNFGFFNVSNSAIGAFNTKSHYIEMFNKPSKWTLYNLMKSPGYHIICLIYQNSFDFEFVEKPSFKDYKSVKDYILEFAIKDNSDEAIKKRQKYYDNLTLTEKQAILDLPNFDADIFKECTGIDVNKID